MNKVPSRIRTTVMLGQARSSFGGAGKSLGVECLSVYAEGCYNLTRHLISSVLRNA